MNVDGEYSVESFKSVIEFTDTFCSCVCFQPVKFENMIDRKGLYA